MRRKTRCFILQDKLPREVERFLREAYTGVEGKEVGYVLISLKFLAMCADG